MDSTQGRWHIWSRINELTAAWLVRNGLQQARRFREVLLLAALASAIWLLLAWPAATGGPQELHFTADADTYVEERSPDTSFGSEVELLTDGSPRRETYLRFTVTGIQGPVERAILRVYVTDSTTNGPIAYAAASNDWDERTLTWNNRPGVVGSLLHDHCTLKAGTWAEFDVTALVTSDGTYSIALIPNSDDGLDVSSREGQYAPELVVVVAAPEEPSTQPVEDTQPPDTVIDSGPPAFTDSQEARFSFHATEPNSAFQCRLDGDTYAPCSTGQTYTGLVEGEHTFEVQALDADGTADPTPASYTWVVDRTPPSPPADLSAVVAGPAQVDLTWTAASDSSPIIGYDLYRDGALLARLDNVTSYSDTTVAQGTTYAYEVRARDAAGNLSEPSVTATVTTPPPAPPPSSSDPVVIVAAGDIACDPQSDSWNDNNGTSSACRHKFTSDVALAQSPDYVLVLGDTQYEDGALQEYRASYDPTWGRLLDRTYPAVGNHEYRTGGAAGYFAYFGDRATPLEPNCRKDCKGYYAWALDEHWVAIAVNSNCGEAGGCQAGSPQYQFVASVLEANAGKHFLVYMHHPYWSTGKYHNCCKGDLADLYMLFERYGVELTLSGHDHNYQRFAPQTASSVCSAGGIRHFVVGSGGKNLQDTDANKDKEPCDEYLNETSFGVLVLRLFPDRYEWAFVSESGAVLDQGSALVS